MTTTETDVEPEPRKPSELMAIASEIVTTLEPFASDTRLQMFAAVLCLQSLASAKAAVLAWQQENGGAR